MSQGRRTIRLLAAPALALALLAPTGGIATAGPAAPRVETSVAAPRLLSRLYPAAAPAQRSAASGSPAPRSTRSR